MVEENDSYTVGYGKPPKHTRFKPGRSGNPRGRPRKRTATFDDDVEVELRSTILITENGKSRRITKRRAIAKQHVLKAIKGDHRSTELLLKSGGQYRSDQQDNLGSLLEEFREKNRSLQANSAADDASADLANSESTTHTQVTSPDAQI